MAIEDPEADVQKIQIRYATGGMFGRIEDCRVLNDTPARVHVVSNMGEDPGKKSLTITDVVPYKGKHYTFTFDCPYEMRDQMLQLSEQVVKTARFE
jgi:hypothetical protein